MHKKVAHRCYSRCSLCPVYTLSAVKVPTHLQLPTLSTTLRTSYGHECRGMHSLITGHVRSAVESVTQK